MEYIKDNKVEQVSETEIENYLHHCKVKNKYSYSSMKQVIASIGYLYKKILQKPFPKALNIELRKPNRLPVVFSSGEIVKILKVTENLKHKTMLFLIYSTGLRLNELLELRVFDIDSEAMRIHIKQANVKRTGILCFLQMC